MLSPFVSKWTLILISISVSGNAFAANCLPTQRSAAKIMAERATRGDQSAKLQAAVFSRDPAALQDALKKLAKKHDLSSSTALDQALAAAAWTDNQYALSTLISAGAKPDGTTEMTASPAIVLAAQCGHTSAVAALVKAGAKVTAGSSSARPGNAPRGALEAAVVNAHPTTAAWLLEHGYEVCGTSEEARMKRLLARPEMSSALPSSLVAKLSCQANSVK